MAKFPYEFPLDFTGAIERTASVALGIAPVATRTWLAPRNAEAILGIVSTASRATVIAREAVSAVGIAETALRSMASTFLDVGPDATDRAFTQAGGVTFISIDNPAEANGVITSIEVWANGSLIGFKVGTFSKSGVYFTPRDSAIIGAVTHGSKQTFTTDENGDPLAIAVESGDYLGVFWTSGAGRRLEWGITGGAGVWHRSGDWFGEQTYYEESTGHIFSCYGSGYSGAGWTRAASVSLGIKATSPIHYVRKAVVALGIAVVATRTWVVQRLAEAALGVLATATRVTVIARYSLPKVGIKTTAIKSHIVVRAATASLGIAVSAVVGLWKTYERLATIYIGIATTASRTTIVSRSAVTALGVAVSALQVGLFMKLAEVAIGIKVTASRTWVANRTADAMLGVATLASGIPSILRHLRVDVITSQYRQVKVITAQNRLVKVVTAQYRKVKALITREE